MVIMSQQKKFSKSRKPKLPRKRKKACIKAQGRASYYSTVNLAKVEGEWPCKFWVNSTVEIKPVIDKWCCGSYSHTRSILVEYDRNSSRGNSYRRSSFHEK